MAKEWIDVVDTAVKIGLGALITGIVTYIGLRFSHRSDKEKYLLEHKTKVLEQISEDIEKYFRAWDYFISRIDGVIAINTILESEGLKEAIRDRDELLTESWSKKESANAKAYLLKANKVATAIADCKELETEFRNKIMFNNHLPTSDEVAKYARNKRTVQKKVHEELSNYYASLAT